MTHQEITKEQFEVISKIANRAISIFDELEDMDDTWIVGREKMHWLMDIEKVHETIGLRLEDLLAADDNNFIHDLSGIASHLNRETGQLEDCFLPRYAIQ